MPLTVTCQANLGAQSTGAFKFVKDLVLEVPRFTANLPRSFVLGFQPRGRGSLLQAITF